MIDLLQHLVELDLPLGGHGYGFDDGFRTEAEGDEREGGIPTMWIVAVVLLAVVTIGILSSCA
jgi:uncharacterized protein YqkB